MSFVSQNDMFAERRREKREHALLLCWGVLRAFFVDFVRLLVENKSV